MNSRIGERQTDGRCGSLAPAARGSRGIQGNPSMNLSCRNEDTAFVTAVEPNGALEAQVLLMAESLRKWGGRLANAPILCVSPRLAPPLHRPTLRAFNRLDVTHMSCNFRHPYAWYAFTNKALAMVAAREACNARTLVWLDADVVILDEPAAFLEDDSDFAACLTWGDLATSGPGHPCDRYWKAVCDLFALNLDELPWVTAAGQCFRYCIQAGVFRMRRSSLVVEHYLRNLEVLMDSQLVASGSLFYSETVALTLAPFTARASWSELPRSHNFVVASRSQDSEYRGLETARVVHYHDAMFAPNWDVLRSYFLKLRPDRLDWLERQAHSRPPPRGRFSEY